MVKNCLVDSEVFILNIDDYELPITQSAKGGVSTHEQSVLTAISQEPAQVYGLDANYKEFCGSIGLPHQIWFPKEMVKNKDLHKEMGITVDEDGFEQEVNQDQGVNFFIWSRYFFKGKADFEQAIKETEEIFKQDHLEKVAPTEKSKKQSDLLS